MTFKLEPGDVAIQVFLRIDRVLAVAHGEMQLRVLDVAGRADIADDIALLHPVVFIDRGAA